MHPMTRRPSRAGFWRNLSRLPGRTSLRIKLIAAVLALVTAALAVISIVGIAYLRGQADQQLTGLVPDIPAPVEHFLSSGQPAGAPFSVQWLTSSGKVRLVAS